MTGAAGIAGDCHWRNTESGCAFNTLLNSAAVLLQKGRLLSGGGIKAALVGDEPAQFHTLLPCQGKWPDAELSQSYGCRTYITPADSQCWAFSIGLPPPRTQPRQRDILSKRTFFFSPCCELHCESQTRETVGLISPSNQKNPGWKSRRRRVKRWLDSTAGDDAAKLTDFDLKRVKSNLRFAVEN